MIRIISGKLKGKKISAPKHFDVRPTTDFAKEALFSIITNRYIISDISVLDLFSGIGSIDYEFASRGCKDITSVELNPKHVKFIQDTNKLLGISEINVVRHNVLSFLEKVSNKKYNIIFADPPFDWEDKQYENLIQSILQHNFLSENGEFILEHNIRKDFSKYPNFNETRKYGNVRFSFFKLLQD